MAPATSGRGGGGEEAKAVVFRVLDDPEEADLKLFADFGDQWDLDVYLQAGRAGHGPALDPDRTRPLSYRLTDFEVTLHFAPTDFLQVNARVNERLVAQTLRLLELRAADRALDLYCGLGNFSLPLARQAGEVLGIEGDGGLVARAAANARLNGLENVKFEAADLNQPGWSFLREDWDAVVLDPPRSGAETVVRQMAEMSPRRIAYISCHPATLARDARTLVHEHGYRLLRGGHCGHVSAYASCGGGECFREDVK